MNPIYLTAIISFMLGLSAVIPLLLNLRARWKARGYALGYDAAHSRLQRSLDECTSRIKALHSDVGQLQHMREIEKRGHQTSLEAIMQDCDERIAAYARRAGAITSQDPINLNSIAKQLENAASTYSHMGATEGARMAHQAQLEALNLAECIRAALEQSAEQPFKVAQERVA